MTKPTPIRGEFQAFHDELLKLFSFVQEELQAIHTKVEKVCSDLDGHKHTLTFSSTSTISNDACRINMSNPNTTQGAHAIPLLWITFYLA